jgi:ABC-type nitrate/sulfonate/bicarbonate transport system permease component
MASGIGGNGAAQAAHQAELLAEPGRDWTGMVRASAVVGFFVLWSLVSWANGRLALVNPSLLPGPWEVGAAAWDMARRGELHVHVWMSVKRVLQGFALGAIVGVALGTIVGQWRWARNVLEPVIELLRPIPPLALLPMMVIWFGIGEWSKIIFIAYACFFPIFVTAVEGMTYADEVLKRAAESLGASRTQRFFYVVLPAATPNILMGLRLGFGLSFFVIVAAEFVAADSGLGYMINEGRNFFLLSQMFAGAILVGLVGLAANGLFRRVEARLLRWREE